MIQRASTAEETPRPQPRLAVHRLPNGLPLRYRSPSDQYIIQESGKKVPPYLAHGDILPTDVFLDIGAQIGVITLWASTTVAQVYSYEPEAENWSILQRNAGELVNVSLHNSFVCGNSYQGDSVPFYVASRNLSAHSAYIKRGRTRVEVPVVRIGEVLQASHATVVKLDCEGAEYDIILDGLLDFPEVEVITFEAHFGRREWHTVFTKLLEILRGKGYTVLGKETSKGWPLFVHASKRL